jgi:hypothetical protein
MGDLFDNPSGAVLAEAGMTRAADHADRVEEKWSDRAYAILQAHAGRHAIFTTEDVRSSAIKAHLPRPPDDRAWGAIMKRGLKARIITAGGFGTSANPLSHCRPIRQWISNTVAVAGTAAYPSLPAKDANL